MADGDVDIVVDIDEPTHMVVWCASDAPVRGAETFVIHLVTVLSVFGSAALRSRYCACSENSFDVPHSVSRNSRDSSASIRCASFALL